MFSNVIKLDENHLNWSCFQKTLNCLASNWCDVLVSPHCKFLARGQSVHYGLFHSPFLLIHNIYPQFLIMISFRFCLENILYTFFFFPFLSVCERIEWLRVHIAEKKEKKLKFKVSLGSETQFKHRTAPANHPYVIDILWMLARFSSIFEF
jgi:hypothetical protein